jgi:2-dehydro-3-deoxyphosphogluconate aldolase / (4S)-4-hydroxy-2-oxoglutarate aldolase
MDPDRFKELPLMGILRGIDEDITEPLIDTVISSGLKTIEVAMNTPGASKVLERAVKRSDSRLMIGAGTVLTMETLYSALDSGAEFIVLPVLVKEVVEYCVKNAIPVFPGALTPKEIYEAWNSGAYMVKVFPAKFFGPAYFKEIKGPFPDMELLACGGISPDSIMSFLNSGASAAAFGASVFRKEWLNAGEFFKVEESIKNLIAAARKV